MDDEQNPLSEGSSRIFKHSLSQALSIGSTHNPQILKDKVMDHGDEVECSSVAEIKSVIVRSKGRFQATREVNKLTKPCGRGYGRGINVAPRRSEVERSPQCSKLMNSKLMLLSSSQSATCLPSDLVSNDSVDQFEDIEPKSDTSQVQIKSHNSSGDVRVCPNSLLMPGLTQSQFGTGGQGAHEGAKKLSKGFEPEVCQNSNASSNKQLSNNIESSTALLTKENGRYFIPPLMSGNKQDNYKEKTRVSKEKGKQNMDGCPDFDSSNVNQAAREIGTAIHSVFGINRIMDTEECHEQMKDNVPAKVDSFQFQQIQLVKKRNPKAFVKNQTGEKVNLKTHSRKEQSHCQQPHGKRGSHATKNHSMNNFNVVRQTENKAFRKSHWTNTPKLSRRSVPETVDCEVPEKNNDENTASNTLNTAETWDTDRQQQNVDSSQEKHNKVPLSSNCCTLQNVTRTMDMKTELCPAADKSHKEAELCPYEKKDIINDTTPSSSSFPALQTGDDHFEKIEEKVDDFSHGMPQSDKVTCSGTDVDKTASVQKALTALFHSCGSDFVHPKETSKVSNDQPKKMKPTEIAGRNQSMFPFTDRYENILDSSCEDGYFQDSEQKEAGGTPSKMMSELRLSSEENSKSEANTVSERLFKFPKEDMVAFESQSYAKSKSFGDGSRSCSDISNYSMCSEFSSDDIDRDLCLETNIRDSSSIPTHKQLGFSEGLHEGGFRPQQSSSPQESNYPLQERMMGVHDISSQHPGHNDSQISFRNSSFPSRSLRLKAKSLSTVESVQKILKFVKDFSYCVQKSDFPIDVVLSIHAAPPSSQSLPCPEPVRFEHAAKPLRKASASQFLNNTFYPPSVGASPLPPYPYWRWEDRQDWHSYNSGAFMDAATPYSRFSSTQRSPCYLSPNQNNDKPFEHESHSPVHPWMYSYWNNSAPVGYNTMDPRSSQFYGGHHPVDTEQTNCHNNATGESVEIESKGTNITHQEGSIDEMCRERKRFHSACDQQKAVRTDPNKDESDAASHKGLPLKKVSRTSSDDGRREYLSRSSVSSFLSPELLKNDWASGTSPSHSTRSTSDLSPTVQQLHSPAGAANNSQFFPTRDKYNVQQHNNDNLTPKSTGNYVTPSSVDRCTLRKSTTTTAGPKEAAVNEIDQCTGADLLNWRASCRPVSSILTPQSNMADWKEQHESPRASKNHEELGVFPQHTRATTPCHKKRRSDASGYRTHPPLEDRNGGMKKSATQGGDRRRSDPELYNTLQPVAEDDSRLCRQPFVERSSHYQHQFVDSHCHIDMLYSRLAVKPDTPFASFRATFAGTFPDNYEGCIAVFCNPRTFCARYPKNQVLQTVCNEPGVWLAMGCHPKCATEFRESHERGLRQMLKHPKVVALGEIGLDYSGIFDQHAETQKEVFKVQLKLAVELDLPLVIHCRDADEDCLEILKETVPVEHKIHAHCFTRNMAMAWRWLTLFPNLYLGLTPVITYLTALDAIDTATQIPLERLLLETDAPYFVPRNMKRGEITCSHPGFALCTAEHVAKLKGIPVDVVLKACRENTRKVYGI